MARELTMPKLSDSMADAVILRWLKAPGDAFERGEGLIEVETDKATVVYEAESAGTLASILVPEGGTAAVGEPIATLGNGEGVLGGEERAHSGRVAPARTGELRRLLPTLRHPRRATAPGCGVRTRRRWRGARPSSSASPSTTSRARGRAAGSRATT